ncbi:MAG: GntR family transcriptional regulator [Gemmatimonadales bacterium]
MFSQIDARRPTPLYDQIAARIRVAVASGELKAGDSLPSVRQLAAQLRINPATVVQAYRELESEGFVEMRQGAGTFVREVAGDRRAEERVEHARRIVQDMLSQGARLGIATSELIRAFNDEVGAGAV